MIFRGDSLSSSHFLTQPLTQSLTQSLTHNLVESFMISAFPFLLHTIANCFIHSHYSFLSDQILFNQSFDILSFPVIFFGIPNHSNLIYTFSHSILSNSILANPVLSNSLLFITILSKLTFSNPNLYNPSTSNPFQNIF